MRAEMSSSVHDVPQPPLETGVSRGADSNTRLPQVNSAALSNVTSTGTTTSNVLANANFTAAYAADLVDAENGEVGVLNAHSQPSKASQPSSTRLGAVRSILSGAGRSRGPLASGGISTKGSSQVGSRRFDIHAPSVRWGNSVGIFDQDYDPDDPEAADDHGDRISPLASAKSTALHPSATLAGMRSMGTAKREWLETALSVKNAASFRIGHVDSTRVKDFVKQTADTPELVPSPFWLWFFTTFKPYPIMTAFSFLVNLVCVIISATGASMYMRAKAPTFGIWCVLVSVLFRNECWVYFLHWLPVKVLPKKLTPGWIKHMIFGFLMNMGGIHSGLGVAALMWLIYNGVEMSRNPDVTAQSIAGLNWTLVGLVLIVCTAAIPYVRVTLHDWFEIFHRLAGWSTLAVLWAFIFTLYSFDPYTGTRWHFQGHRMANNTEIWAAAFITFLVILPWTYVRKLNVGVEHPSKTVTVLTFPGGTEAGFFGKVSRKPLLEWHTFALIAEEKKGKEATHFMVVGAVGDFTKGLHTDPPKQLWSREIHAVGPPYLMRMYNRGLLVCTGAGIAVAVPIFLQGYGDEHHLLWVAKDVRKTFGDKLCDIMLKRNNITLFDTGVEKQAKRPNLMDITAKLFWELNADVVLVTSNPIGTNQCVDGCRALGIPAFGPVFDS